jgi:tetratricopeptide (TPR) repeat protein
MKSASACKSRPVKTSRSGRGAWLQTHAGCCEAFHRRQALRGYARKGVDDAIKTYRYLKTNKRDLYDFDEASLQELGSYLLTHDKPKNALEFLRLNAEEYPSSSKAYANLAEAYARNGDNSAAIANYQRVLKLDPSNSQAAEALKNLQN